MDVEAKAQCPRMRVCVCVFACVCVRQRRHVCCLLERQAGGRRVSEAAPLAVKADLERRPAQAQAQ